MGNETNVGYRPLEFAPVLTRVNKLQADRRYRDAQKLFFAEGIRNFIEAVDHNYPIDTIIYSEKLLVSPVARKLVRQLKRKGRPFARASPEQFRTISRTERASGIVAIFRQDIKTLQQIIPESHICWTVLDNIRSLGNFGTLVRTSAAIGAGGFILLGELIDPFDPAVVRAIMGSLFKQTIIHITERQLQHWVNSYKLSVVGASPSGAVDYDQVRFSTPTVLLLGNERSGLTADQQALCNRLVRIPMVAGIDSLNVAVAGSLLLYEAFRSSKHN